MTGRVVLLCGSPRLEGNTALVLGECAKVLEREGIETETILLAENRILSCTACGLCTGGECALDDSLNDIIRRIREAEGFIVGTPVYFGTARGDVLSALQRIGMVSMSSDSFLSRKVGGPIAVARRGGHTATLQELLMFFLINDMIVPGSTYWNMVFGRTPGEAVNDEEGMKTVRRFAENVAFLIKRLQ
ncbi:NADPH-dependent FMN reductase [Methanoculleus bourgensis MS2]|uniref:NADPH-dependent FMN reductase n=1 Tax=Methanoculleus bourgensis (strain ATCC 43281 / DSM 3045 / OCM 15 / MS2) TaxID=1201294 RepID=I7KXA7_METBM|nr:flavodoxin family protein [Methanoculleus bourgensis]GLI45466.1 FMN reductase [Methanoculleus bourgensis]CCJ35040.1 NADPH-dependent FMN reductase [Methanoculleus bourgensis MS2]